MAEALFTLTDELHWSPINPPIGEIILVSDTIEASGSFLVHHFLALFLKAGQRVCFIILKDSKLHYAAVARKLSVNLGVMEANKQVKFIDLLSKSQNNCETLIDLLSYIEAFILDNDSSTIPVIIFDDISYLKWCFGELETINFIRCIKALIAPNSGNLLLTCHSDTDENVPELGVSTRNNFMTIKMEMALRDIATVVLETRPLPSGYSKDVHGMLSIEQQSNGHTLAPKRTTVSYKTLENSVRCFQTSGDRV